MKPTYDFLLDKYLCHKHDSGDFTGLIVNPISIAYGDLIVLQTGSLLEPGQQYKITDFATKHRILDGNSVTTDYNTGVNEPLILTATSSNTFDKQVYSPLHPFDIIYYDITGGDTRDIAFFDEGVAITGLKGVIYYRKDTIQNVETWYDFRNVKFRRWLVSAKTWISGGTYTLRDVYEFNNVLYKCIKGHTGLTDTPDVDTTNWIKWLDKTQNWSWTTNKRQFNIGNVSLTNLIMSDPIDVYTFGDYYNWVNDVEIGKIYLDFVINTYNYSSKLNNIVFYTTDDIYTCLSNVFGDNCFLNTVGNGFRNNTVGNDFLNNTVGNDFYYNTVGNYFNTNTVGNDFYYNTVGNYFNTNMVGNGFNNNTVGNSFNNNTVGNDFLNNTVGNDFLNNTVGNDFYYNTVGNYFNTNMVGNGFNNNTVKNYFNNNIIGVSFNNNTIENNFAYNIIKDDFYYNTIFDGFYHNDIGVNFSYNNIDNDFQNNKIDNNFYKNIIESNFRHNTTILDFQYNKIMCATSNINFSTATHVYGNYNCEIFKNSAGVLRLKYVDADDNDVVTNITT